MTAAPEVSEVLDLSGVTVLIPAAGPVPEGIVSLSSISTAAMIPVAGAPVIDWNLRYLIRLGFRRFRLALPQRGLAIEDYLDCVFGDDIECEIIVPSADRGVGFTVLELAGGASGPVLVVLGDTLFEFDDASLPADEVTVLTSTVDDPERWCVAVADADGVVSSLVDKPSTADSPQSALIGVYLIPDAGLARESCAGLLEGGGRIELSSVLRLLANRWTLRAVRAGRWLDCGNPDTQEASRRALLQQRSFNSLVFDERRGVVRKSSTNKEKFIDEINYLRLLPPSLAPLFPRVIDAVTEWSDPWVELEYYGYPTLTELFLYEPLGPAVWRRIFTRLRHVLELFSEHARPVSIEDQKAMYLDKPRDRLSFEGEHLLHDMIRRPSLIVNGSPMANVQDRWSEIAAWLEADCYPGAVGSVVHGDFCLSNVLFDVRSGVCKLIDPRGSFGRVGLYGDQRYDIAKLYHSVVGEYDQIVAGLFDLKTAADEVEFRVRSTKHQNAARDVFRDELLTGQDELAIAMITGLTFVGLPVLHTESLPRQQALYVRGLQMIDGALAGRLM